MERPCMGDILLSTGVVKYLLATGSVLEATAGMFLGIPSDFEDKWELEGPKED